VTGGRQPPSLLDRLSQELGGKIAVLMQHTKHCDFFETIKIEHEVRKPRSRDA